MGAGDDVCMRQPTSAAKRERRCPDIPADARAWCLHAALRRQCCTGPPGQHMHADDDVHLQMLLREPLALASTCGRECLRARDDMHAQTLLPTSPAITCARGQERPCMGDNVHGPPLLTTYAVRVFALQIKN